MNPVSDIGSALGKLPAPPQFWSKGLEALLNNLTEVLLIASVIVALALILAGGIKWAMSGGDKEAVGSAQKTITAAIVGLIIVFSAWAIINLIKAFFGIGGFGGGGGGGGGSPAGPTGSAGPAGSPYSSSQCPLVDCCFFQGGVAKVDPHKCIAAKTDSKCKEALANGLTQWWCKNSPGDCNTFYIDAGKWADNHCESLTPKN